MLEELTENAENKTPTGRPLTSHRYSAILPMLPGLADKSGADVLELLKACITKAELTSVAEVEAAFQPYGMSAIVVLQESHVAAHCWPEINKVLLDVHICDYFSDNKTRAEALCQALGATFGGDDSLERWHYARIDEKPGFSKQTGNTPE